MPMSKAMRSALAAVARMKGDTEVSMDELQKAMAAAGARRPEVDEEDGCDRDVQWH